MVPFNLKVLAKFGHCSNCSQKLDECSPARARMPGFSLKFPYGKTEPGGNLGGKCNHYESVWKR